MNVQRVIGVATRLLGWTLLGTMSGIVFCSVFGSLVLWLLFGHPLVFFAGLIFGPLAGAIGGPVFGIVYGAAVEWRGQPAVRIRAVLLAGALGGVIFGAVGAGFHAWDASQRAHEPMMQPRMPNPVKGAVATDSEGGQIVASPEGGRVVEVNAPIRSSSGSSKVPLGWTGFGAIGGFLYGALFGALFRSRQRKKRFEMRPGMESVLDDDAHSRLVTRPTAAVNFSGMGMIGISVLILLGGLIVIAILVL